MIGSLQTFEKPRAVAYSGRFSQIAGESSECGKLKGKEMGTFLSMDLTQTFRHTVACRSLVMEYEESSMLLVNYSKKDKILQLLT